MFECVDRRINHAPTFDFTQNAVTVSIGYYLNINTHNEQRETDNFVVVSLGILTQNIANRMRHLFLPFCGLCHFTLINFFNKTNICTVDWIIRSQRIQAEYSNILMYESNSAHKTNCSGTIVSRLKNTYEYYICVIISP